MNLCSSALKGNLEIRPWSHLIAPSAGAIQAPRSRETANRPCLIGKTWLLSPSEAVKGNEEQRQTDRVAPHGQLPRWERSLVRHASAAAGTGTGHEGGRMLLVRRVRRMHYQVVGTKSSRNPFPGP